MEDLAQSRDKPPPEEDPPRKVGVRGVPTEEGRRPRNTLEEDLGGRPPPEEYPAEEYPQMITVLEKNSGPVSIYIYI